MQPLHLFYGSHSTLGLLMLVIFKIFCTKFYEISAANNFIEILTVIGCQFYYL